MQEKSLEERITALEKEMAELKKSSLVLVQPDNLINEIGKDICNSLKAIYAEKNLNEWL